MAGVNMRRFYNSKQWKATRNAYLKSQHGICERCKAKGKITAGSIVHHIDHLDEQSVFDRKKALGLDNLQLLCRPCHAEVHPELYDRNEYEPCRVKFDKNGDIVDE